MHLKHLVALALFAAGAVLAAFGKRYALACVAAGLFVVEL